MPVRPLGSFRGDQYFRGIKPQCLVSAHTASHNSPAAPCKCLNEPFGTINDEWNFSFQMDVYLKSALTRRATAILMPAVSDFNV